MVCEVVHEMYHRVQPVTVVVYLVYRLKPVVHNIGFFVYNFTNQYSRLRRSVGVLLQ